MRNKRKKSWNKLSLFLAGLLLLALIALVVLIKHTINSNIQKKQTYGSKPTTQISTVSPKLENQTANWKTYTIPEDPNFHFKLPPNWNNLEFWKPMPPNAYGIQSEDFRSQHYFSRISSGSIITIVSYDFQGTYLPTEEEAAQIEGNGDAKILGYYQTPDFKAIKFTHHCCEDGNSTYEFLFFKKGKKYTIAQHYVLNGTNPYPGLLDQIVSTVTFTK